MTLIKRVPILVILVVVMASMFSRAGAQSEGIAAATATPTMASPATTEESSEMVSVYANGEPETTSSTAEPSDAASVYANGAVSKEPNDAAAESNSQSDCREPLSAAFVDPGLINGTDLALLLALPLTYKGEAYLNPGFFQLASALMAIDHFNARKTTIVPELADLKDCPIHIDYESLQVMDTGTVERNAMGKLLRILEDQDRLPNAIVGPYNELPSIELSVLASTLKIPMVTHRGIDHNLLQTNKHPFVTQVNPDLYADMGALADYLQYTGRTDYIAVLYAAGADSAIQRLEVFRGVTQSLSMKNVQSFGYVSPFTPVAEHHPVQNITVSMRNLKRSGYRTIVWLTPYFDEEILLVGRAAREFELDNGDYFWVIGAAMEIDKPLEAIEDTKDNSTQSEWGDSLHDVDVADFADLGKLETHFNSFEEINFIRNAAFLRQAELIDVLNPDHSPFMREWTQLNDTFVERLLQLNPIETEKYQSEWFQYSIISPMLGWVNSSDFPKGPFPPEDLFAKPVAFLSSPPSGSLNLYDAIMAIGIGACDVFRETNETGRAEDAGPSHKAKRRFTGKLLQQGIRSSHFWGASGEVQFGDGYPGSRRASTVTFHVVNLFPTGFLADLYAVSQIRNASGAWWEFNPFIYAGGLNEPPPLLRDPANQNYLSQGVRIAGLTLMSIALFACLSTFGWVVIYRQHSLVLASQPLFLGFILLGSSLTAWSILFFSFDESHGWTADQLTKACKAVPWFVTLGHIFVYNCLFAKLWRVNRVLQFSRRKVKFIHVLWPSWLIEMAAFILLSIWTATTDYRWERHEVDAASGDTIGQCRGDDEDSIWIPICILLMIPTILTGVMSWKTIDVDATYSEAKWIFALMLVQCQVIIVAVPMMIILGDLDTDGRFLGGSLILWTFPMTTIGLIFVPKMVAVHFPAKERRESRGATGGTRISGIPSSRDDKSGPTTASDSRQFHSSHQSEASPISQSTLSALERSNRHSHVTFF